MASSTSLFCSVMIIILFTVPVHCIPRRLHLQKPEQEKEKLILEEEDKNTIQKLTPRQLLVRLSEIADKIDSNGDGIITKEELKSWIEYVDMKHLSVEVERYWMNYDRDNDGLITWDEFKNTTYGHTNENDSRIDDINFRQQFEINKMKWLDADIDKDNALTKIEYSAFLNPGEYKRMHKSAAVEMFYAIDTNQDGAISLEEYLGEAAREVVDGQPAEWVDEEKRVFSEERDVDHDGQLNKQEVEEWLFPKNYDQLDSEVKHLIHKADDNKDQSLSKQEILNHYEEFVGSQATAYGETLQRPIDEL